VLAPRFTPAQSFVRSGKYRFQFLREGRDLRVHATDGTRDIEAPLEWAFGAGTQAVTFASRVDKDWYLEHSLSYFTLGDTYASTPGQPAPAVDILPAALGRLYRSQGNTDDIVSCFQCHSTGPVSRSASGELKPSDAGVKCEACHGPGLAHVNEVQAGGRRVRQTIQNPGRTTAVEMNTACGNCHRPPASAGAQVDWKVAWNVRHQPVYLSESACFLKSEGALRCTTCHNPHTSLSHDSGGYNAKCSACHSEGKHPPATVCLRSAAKNCIECHMPRVSPQSYLAFTNHWIGVYGPGDKLKPLARSAR
jgi:hypothetical protein